MGVCGYRSACRSPFFEGSVPDGPFIREVRLIRQSTVLAASRSSAPELDGDAALAARCRDGDETAWETLYDAHFDFVYRVARQLGVPEHDGEDVSHDVFIVAHAKIGAFTDGRLSTWLYRITANVVRDYHRRWKVRRSLELVKTWLWGVTVRNPESIAEQRSASRAVEQVLATMSPKKREVFALFELEGLDGAEIALRVGCPEGTVWTRLHHARKDFVRIARRLGCLEEVE